LKYQYWFVQRAGVALTSNLDRRSESYVPTKTLFAGFNKNVFCCLVIEHYLYIYLLLLELVY